MPEQPKRTRMAVPNSSATHSARRRSHGLFDWTASKRTPSKIGRSTKDSRQIVNMTVRLALVSSLKRWSLTETGVCHWNGLIGRSSSENLLFFIDMVTVVQNIHVIHNEYSSLLYLRCKTEFLSHAHSRKTNRLPDRTSTRFHPRRLVGCHDEQSFALAYVSNDIRSCFRFFQG